MGFGSLATYVIMFSVGLSVVVGFMFSFKTSFAQSSASLEERQEISKAKLQSDMEIMGITYNETQEEQHVIWNTTSDFNEGIFDNTTASNTSFPDSIILSYDNLTGAWYSEIIEFNGTVNYTFINSSGNELTGNIDFQIRSAENKSALTGEFVGPDGTNQSAYTLGSTQEISAEHDGDDVIQLKVSFSRLTSTVDIELDWVTLGYQHINVLEATIKNTGEMRLDKDILDVFVNGDRIPRDSIISAEVIESTDITNPGLWEPEEEITLKLSTTLQPGTKMFTLSNEYATKAHKKAIIS